MHPKGLHRTEGEPLQNSFLQTGIRPVSIIRNWLPIDTPYND